MKILMVCLGNICRSPLAEGILQEISQRAGLNWIVESAGTNGFHTGQSPHPLSQKIAKINGIDISKQVSRKFEKADLDNYDKIYVMASDVLYEMKDILGHMPPKDKVDIFLNNLYPGKNMDVPDPWYGTEKDYHEAYALIEKTCNAIIDHYLALHPQTEKV